MSIADYIIERAKRTPYFHLEGYMRRWWLVPYTSAGSAAQAGDGTGVVSWWRRPIARVLQALGIAIRVHEILRSDIGRDPHDHPWNYLTVVLRGGYIEQRYDADGVLLSAAWHGPGSVLFRRATDLHKLVLREHLCFALSDPRDVRKYVPATTLFVTGRYLQGWGFKLRNGPKVPHREYLR